MNDDIRELFDSLLGEVIESLPQSLQYKLEEIPVIVEDYPSRRVMEEMGIGEYDDLCGLHSGIPLTQRSVEHSGVLPDTIMIYRRGVCSMATNRRGKLDEDRLHEQIRITLLHEIGHHFGLDEDDLAELGYG